MFEADVQLYRAVIIAHQTYKTVCKLTKIGRKRCFLISLNAVLQHL